MTEEGYDLGIVGLGVMGRNLLLNMADKGFALAGYDLDASKVQALDKESGERQMYAAESLEAFVAALRKPRAVMMLVPAGPPVDSVISDLLPHLEQGDLIIDGGNSHYPDTELRAGMLRDRGIDFLGVGISGGEEGARHGPSMMPGGPRSAYERVQSLFESAAAKVDGEPCVAYLGPGSAGHYVKMVHNGIEYGFMQLIAESYHLMKRALGMDEDQLHAVFSGWNARELNSYLIEITADIFCQPDERSDKRLIDVIEDVARQKGTGRWTSQDAMDLQVPVPNIDIAVIMRNLSSFEDQRAAVNQAIGGEYKVYQGDKAAFLEQLREALYAAMILTYTQGMAQLHTASVEKEYHLDLETVARIWRGGCIIRADLLEDIRAAFQVQPDLPNLLLDEGLGGAIKERQDSLRAVVLSAAELGIPMPGMMAALSYFDAFRSDWLPANLIQAQRDYFGSHSYERIDEKGKFHTEWQADER